MKRYSIVGISICALFLWLGLFSSASAKVYSINGRQLTVFGYFTQGVSYNLVGDEPDNEEDFNSAIFTLFGEAEYRMADRFRVFGSAKLTGDWIYDIKHGDGSWNAKEFDRSAGTLHYDDEYWQIINELHATWTPPNSIVRIGKQIVVWGEMDGNRIMDQINPIDQRRGFADVEFETSIVPIWLAKAEYYPYIDSETILDLGLELTFNPNADFIPSQPAEFGNDVGGIWAPNMVPPTGNVVYYGTPPFPPGAPPMFLPVPFPGATSYPVRMGRQYKLIDEPDAWDPEGFEYGLRLKTLISDSVVTLNYFYGRDNLPVTRTRPGTIPKYRFMEDGTVVMETEVEGYYPLQRFAGATLSQDLRFLKSSFLGGVSPILRLEALYGFNSTYTQIAPSPVPGPPAETFEEFDDLKWGIGLDWKVKADFLNPRSYFTISPQFFHTHVFGYPDGGAVLLAPGGAGTEMNNYSASVMISTQYLHQKLKPSFFVLHDITNKADFFRAQVAYDYSDNWQFLVGAMWLGGSEPGKSFHLFRNKDQAFFKVSYKFN